MEKKGKVLVTDTTHFVTLKMTKDEILFLFLYFLKQFNRHKLRLLENFCPTFYPDPTDCPWVSEDGCKLAVLIFTIRPV